MIREMQYQDIEVNMDLWKEHFSKVAEGMIGTLDTDCLIQFFKSLIDSGKFVSALSLDEENKAQGIIGWFISPNPYNTQELLANELFWYSPQPRIMVELFNHVEEQIQKRNVIGLNIGIPENSTLGKWLEKRGYNLSRKQYSKILKGKEGDI